MKPISRRQFSQRLINVLMYGGFTHFTFTTAVMATDSLPLQPSLCPGGGHEQDLCLPTTGKQSETDICPGGRDTEDVCLPEQGYTDYCPGEKMPEDKCPPSGDRAEDRCSTGRPEADICTAGILIGGKSPDQCPMQNASTDDCKPNEDDRFDVCWSGLPKDDECESSGGRTTDECPGGGAERDTCENEIGDECSIDKQQPEGSDKCPHDWGAPDVCGFDGSADNCYEGTNDRTGFGGTDICNNAFGQQIGGGDTCLDGSVQQDVCGGIDDTHDEYDVCVPTAEGEGNTDDLCNPGERKGSEDSCFDGRPSSDKCEDIKGDVDECPGGMSDDVAPSAGELRSVRYRFHGRERSAATGLVNFRMRWYDPVTGRWLSKDPIRLRGGLNLYAFCHGRPLTDVDHYGLCDGDGAWSNKMVDAGVMTATAGGLLISMSGQLPPLPPQVEGAMVAGCWIGGGALVFIGSIMVAIGAW